MLTDAPFTFREFMTEERLPLAQIFQETFGFLQGRRDAVVFGAQAVNAYCDVQRMTKDIDILSTEAEDLAFELSKHLSAHFHIAVRVRRIAHGRGFRVYQLRKPTNRHLVDVRQVESFPPTHIKSGIAVVSPEALLAMKVIGYQARKHEEKGLSDHLDIHRMLNCFPELREPNGKVTRILQRESPDRRIVDTWIELLGETVKKSSDTRKNRW